MNTKNILYSVGLMLILGACSQYSTSPISVAFHNTNAKFNALLQARDKLTEADKIIFESRKDNYTQILPILVPTDSLAAGAVNEQLTAVIKKASLIAERHQNSKWLDDAYLLIGQARLLKEDYKNAIETFKFVNTTATGENERHSALIGLMRAYIEQEEFSTALRVANLLKEEELNKKNTRDFYLTKAYLHELKGEYKVSVGILEEAFPLMKKNEQKARVFYAAAQMYELINNREEASACYLAANKSNPSYELGFYARLNNALLLDETDSFEKLLNDPKNHDLEDKIYEAMAAAALRKGKTKDGVALLKQASTNNQDVKQLPYTFLKLADLYYTKLINYEVAAAYYDSTAQSLPQNDPQYKRVIETQRMLSAFMKQKGIINTEDSLQRLAKLPAAELDKELTKAIRRQQAEEEANVRKSQEILAKAMQPKISSIDNFADPNKISWYFTNAMALSQGKTTFTTLWGTRTLEDNWRRINKDNGAFFNGNTASAGQRTRTYTQEEKVSPSAKLEAQKATFKSQLPFSSEALVASQKRKEDAIFELGKIYKLDLNEPKNAIATFEKLLMTFPSTEHEAETLYLLCLLNEDNPATREQYKARLLKKYNDSYFARLLNRGTNETLSTGKEIEAQKLYAEAYSYYEATNYPDALAFINTALKDYPNSQIEDKFVFLKTILLSKTENKEVYQKALSNFVKDYPKSSLLVLAKERLAVFDNK
jgi:outer membrane protein assembly factor BamD (BamD/ComL family)